MRRSPLTALARPGAARPTSIPKPCPRDIDCSCRSTKSHHAASVHGAPSTIVHVDHCDDPDCHEVEQLKALQKSLDHFTDYEHYERCCDSHHHGPHHEDECCLDHDSPHFNPEEPCADYFDECDECADEHKDCYDEVDIRDEDCEQCEEECEELGHEPEDCPHNHPTTRDNCIPCQDEQIPLPLLGPTNEFDAHAIPGLMQDITPCSDDCNVPMQTVPDVIRNTLAGMVFDNDMDHWQTFVQTHHCAPDPCMIGRPPQFQHPQHMDPSFGFTFGCDPTNPANQYPWQKQIPLCNLPLIQQASVPDINTFPTQQLPKTNMPTTSPTSSCSKNVKFPTNVSNPPTRTCEWIMPCGSICGASFPRTEDLKKHIKNSHSTKETVTCHWKSCTASFATEAALTGHISKKHLTVSDEEGPWKCTFPGCTKSFMYKQVRDDHVASHNGGNRMHCPICHQWLNCEGSNFRRHMASHGPKNEHMRCRYESLGCKKRFPRLDNLRRHEACCKFGKRAAGIHHHHHRVHIGHGL